jgi:hypothetical protein
MSEPTTPTDTPTAPADPQAGLAQSLAVARKHASLVDDPTNPTVYIDDVPDATPPAPSTSSPPSAAPAVGPAASSPAARRHKSLVDDYARGAMSVDPPADPHALPVARQGRPYQPPGLHPTRRRPQTLAEEAQDERDALATLQNAFPGIKDINDLPGARSTPTVPGAVDHGPRPARESNRWVDAFVQLVERVHMERIDHGRRTYKPGVVTEAQAAADRTADEAFAPAIADLWASPAGRKLLTLRERVAACVDNVADLKARLADLTERRRDGLADGNLSFPGLAALDTETVEVERHLHAAETLLVSAQEAQEAAQAVAQRALTVSLTAAAAVASRAAEAACAAAMTAAVDALAEAMRPWLELDWSRRALSITLTARRAAVEVSKGPTDTCAQEDAHAGGAGQAMPQLRDTAAMMATPPADTPSTPSTPTITSPTEGQS